MKTAIFVFVYVFVSVAFIHTVLSHLRMWVEIFREERIKKN